MKILLSSIMRPRYKEDILRCLAAPLDSKIQFRYMKNLVDPHILENNENATGHALICFIDIHGPKGSPLPLIPIRIVNIEQISLHGETISLNLKMKDFASNNTFNPKLFAEEIYSLSEKNTPTAPLKGYYFTSISELPSSISKVSTTQQWEKTIAQFKKSKDFGKNPFFWTVLGIEPAEKLQETHDTEKFSPWPTNLGGGKSFNIVIYHRHLGRDRIDPKERISLVSRVEGALEAEGFCSLIIDSHYDLKRWRFKAKSKSHFAQRGWVRIGPEGNWSIELPLKIKGSWLKSIIITFILGLLVGLPEVLLVLQNTELGPTAKFLSVTLSIIVGLGAAIVIVFGLKRI